VQVEVVPDEAKVGVAMATAILPPRSARGDEVDLLIVARAGSVQLVVLVFEPDPAGVVFGFNGPRVG